MIEAFSAESYEDALNRALAEAARHLSVGHDAQIMSREFSYSDGTQYRVMLDVMLVSASLGSGEAQRGFKEVARKEGRGFKIFLSDTYAHMNKMIAQFQKDKVYVNLATMPDIILSRLESEAPLETIVVVDFQGENNTVSAPVPANGPGIAPAPTPEAGSIFSRQV